MTRSDTARIVLTRHAKPCWLPLPLKLSLSLSLSMHHPMLSPRPSLSMHEPLLSLSMLVLDPNHLD